MSKIVNVEILGHPLNWLIIIGVVLMVWFGFYAIHARAGVAPAPAE